MEYESHGIRYPWRAESMECGIPGGCVDYIACGGRRIGAGDERKADWKDIGGYRDDDCPVAPHGL